MVGRGWWLLVWTLCAAWTVCVVHGGSVCQQGQEFYNSQQGKCVPCTRCHGPLVVAVPCYVYQDAVCAPATHFIPTWSRHNRPQAPITLSTPTTLQNQTKEERGHGKRIPKLSSGSHSPSDSKKSGHHVSTTNKDSNATSHKSNHKRQNSSSILSQNNTEKSRRENLNHHHRHKHSGERSDHRSHEKSMVVMKGASVSQRSGGASEDVSVSAVSVSVNGVDRKGSSDSESLSVDISDGANSDKDRNSDSQELETFDWQKTLFFTTIIVISISVIVLSVFIISHLRNIFTRRKLKRVGETMPEESSGEVTVMAQLLSENSTTTPRTAVVHNRYAATGARIATSTAIVTSPSAVVTSGPSVQDSERMPGQVYPPIPFTMDRLLEQRRVLGPASSVDTNLYIESWQQQDNQPAIQFPSSASPLVSHRSPPQRSVSACPSPVPVRTYRLGPASASASPVVTARGLGPPRGRMRGTFVSPAYTLSNSSSGVALSGCSSLATT